jgi:hypothetical protein
MSRDGLSLYFKMNPRRLFKMGLRQRKSRTIDTIQETVAVNKLSSPAIIFMEVVGDSKKSRFYEELKSNHNTTSVWKEMNCINIFKNAPSQYAYCRREM